MKKLTMKNVISLINIGEYKKIIKDKKTNRKLILYENINAIGKSLKMSRRKNHGRNILRAKVISKIDQCKTSIHECKKFVDRWNKLNKIEQENNRALRIEDKVELTPEEDNLNNFDDMKQDNCEIMRYKSYLKSRYRFLANKSNKISDYCFKSNQDQDQSSFENYENPGNLNVSFPRINDRYHKKPYINSLSKIVGSKSYDEMVDEVYRRQQEIRYKEKLNRIKYHLNKPDVLISDLRSRYKSLYENENLKKLLDKPYSKPISLIRNYVIDYTKEPISDESKDNMYLTEVPTANNDIIEVSRLDEKKTDKREIYTKASKSNHSDLDQSNVLDSNVHIGTEFLPYRILKNLNNRRK